MARTPHNKKAMRQALNEHKPSWPLVFDPVSYGFSRPACYSRLLISEFFLWECRRYVKKTCFVVEKMSPIEIISGLCSSCNVGKTGRFQADGCHVRRWHRGTSVFRLRGRVYFEDMQPGGNRKQPPAGICMVTGPNRNLHKTK